MKVSADAPLNGSVRVPGDKSVTHRALMIAAICDGVTEIVDPGTGADNLSTLSAIRALGVEAEHDDAHHFTVRGAGMHGLAAAAEPIDCGNSGTTARLLTGLLAGAGVKASLVGDESLSRRPMRRIADPLSDLGYKVGTAAGGLLPITVTPSAPQHQAVRAELVIASAQVKSAILLSGLYRSEMTEVVEPAPSRDHTERLLRALGVRVQSSPHYRNPTQESDGLPFCRLHPPTSIEARTLEVPGDASSAAFHLVAGALAGEGVCVENMGLNPTRAAFMSVLERMGSSLTIRNRRTLSTGEPVADVMASRSELRGTVLGGREIPSIIDEIPILCVLGAACTGTFEVRDAKELRVKETDRIAATAALLRVLGVDVEESEDGLRFEGLGKAAFAGGSVVTHGDHRIAMAACVAGVCSRAGIEIDDPGCIDVSYPEFSEHIAALGAKVE